MIPGSTQPAYMVREQGKTFKDVLRAQVPNFDQLDSHRRLLAEISVTRCSRAAGIKKRVFPHLLRHSIATILLDSGLVPVDQVQKFLGHLHLSTTQIIRRRACEPSGELYPGFGREAVVGGCDIHGLHFAEI